MSCNTKVKHTGDPTAENKIEKNTSKELTKKEKDARKFRRVQSSKMSLEKGQEQVDTQRLFTGEGFCKINPQYTNSKDTSRTVPSFLVL